MKRRYPDLPSYVQPDTPEEIRRVNRLFDIIFGPVKRRRKKKATAGTQRKSTGTVARESRPDSAAGSSRVTSRAGVKKSRE